ncbi:MAG TPA: hypothetical protein IAC02_00560 [Candidatus Coprovivens excrementavium]|nr:hypothetical protein [Candidatus Coprovivens excrementavium]
MSSKKKILTIIIISLIVIAVAAITIKLVGDLNKETTLKNEVKEISKFMNINQNENDEINEILTRREITKGKYKNIENDIKQYYQVIYSDLQNFSFLIDNDNFNIYLSSENLNEDKPSFIKSKDNLQNTKAQIDEYYNKLIKELNDESIKLSFITEDRLDSYYRNFYLELTSLAISDNLKKELDTAYEEVLSKIEIYNEALDFLVANKGHWAIKNNVIIFDDTILYEGYLEITNKLEVSEN